MSTLRAPMSAGQEAMAFLAYHDPLTGLANRASLAEGVENADHVDFLAVNGCRIAQGFHFGRPVPGPEITALLAESIAPDRRR